MGDDYDCICTDIETVYDLKKNIVLSTKKQLEYTVLLSVFSSIFFIPFFAVVMPELVEQYSTNSVFSLEDIALSISSHPTAYVCLAFSLFSGTVSALYLIKLVRQIAKNIPRAMPPKISPAKKAEANTKKSFLEGR